jgi:hypothetical protein
VKELVVGVLVALLQLVLRREYDDWAPRLAAWMIRAAAWCHPESNRMREEWLAELASIQDEASEALGLTYAISLLARYSWRGLAVISPPVAIAPVVAAAVGLPLASPDEVLEMIGGAMIPPVLITGLSLWMAWRRRHGTKRLLPRWMNSPEDVPRWAWPLVMVTLAAALAAALFLGLVAGLLGPQNPIGTAAVVAYIVLPFVSRTARGWLLAWDKARRQLLGLPTQVWLSWRASRP